MNQKELTLPFGVFSVSGGWMAAVPQKHALKKENDSFNSFHHKTHMNKNAITLQVSAVLALTGGQVSAAVNLIPNGGFQMYKPGTNETVTAEFAAGNSFTNSFEGVVTLAGGSVNYSDSTTGTEIVMPGWVNVGPAGAGLFTLGVDGSTSMETFASWGGSNGDIIGSASSLGNIQALDYTLSALVKGGNSGNPSAILADISLDLYADGVLVTPTSLSGPPPAPAGDVFHELTRTYAAADLAPFLGQSMTVQFGTNPTNTAGGRASWDNISLTVIPEPSSAMLLGLGGLALGLRRSRKK